MLNYWLNPGSRTSTNENENENFVSYIIRETIEILNSSIKVLVNYNIRKETTTWVKSNCIK